MDSFLLATKLRIPPQPHDVVRRARLIDALERGIPAHKLTLISAPAGYGKTTLLAQWAHQRAQSSALSTAWLTISREDNDVERFLRYLLRAWEEVQPDVMQTRVGLLLSAMSPDSEAVLSAFINVAGRSSDTLVFILDDYHLIEDAAIHQALTFLLDNLPPTLHFVLLSRAQPPLPLARYRARHELLELRAEELCFQREETENFLNSVMALELPDEEVVTLQAQLEGWIAGLQLAALSRRQRLAGADKLVVSGRHRFIADYLSEDVLAPLADEMRRFLLQTSILDRLCGSLCDAVTGRVDSQSLLETIERENLFLVPLDDSRRWFRYHRLFADFLIEELKRRHPDEVAGLHRRAARWYLTHNLSETSFHHALEGGDVETVIQIFDKYLNAKLNSGEIRVVGKWIDAIPAEWYAAHPVLGLGRVGFLVYNGAFETAMHYVDELEQRLTPAENENLRWQLARVTAVRCLMACAQDDLARAEVYAGHALQELPEEDLNWRPGVYAALGDAYRRKARWEEAKNCYLKALAVTDSPSLRFFSAHLYGALADLVLRQGRLRATEGYWRKALVVMEERENWGRLDFPVIGWVYIRMGELLYEWNELAEAWSHLSQGLERAELGGDVRALIAGYLIAGRMKLTEGDLDTAANYLERARPLTAEASFSYWTSRFERLQLELWLEQDSLRTAVVWIDRRLRDDVTEEQSENEPVHVAIARVLIAKGDKASLERASRLLARLLQVGEAEGRTGVIIEVQALQALIYFKRRQHPDALTTLERALRAAEPEGYVRLFADLGLPMARLLQEAHLRAVMPDYVGTLLAAFDTDSALLASTERWLPEPLTPRERETLELIAAGLTNREIAEKLIISPETVKKHASNIYGKLGVHSRIEAIARARELDLLD